MWQNYIAIGDSVTAGVGDPVDGMGVRSWTEWLADSLATLTPGFTFTNLGRAGSTTGDVLRGQLPLTLERMPDLVSVTSGANDARLPAWAVETFADEYNALLSPITDLDAVIITMTYPDLSIAIAKGKNQIPKQWQRYFDRMKDTNHVIREASLNMDACLLDLENFPPAQKPAHISSDLVHPNALGYQIAADAAFQILSARFDLDRAKR